MGVNIVVYGGDTLIDLSGDTITEDTMLSGVKAHDKAGNPITGAIPSQPAQTIMPGTADQTIQAGQYLTGAQTIKGDANLTPANIKKGVSIFGIAGTLEEGSGGSGGSVPTCNVVCEGNYGYCELVYSHVENDAVVFSGTGEDSANGVICGTMLQVYIEPEEGADDYNVLRVYINGALYDQHNVSVAAFYLPIIDIGENNTVSIRLVYS